MSKRAKRNSNRTKGRGQVSSGLEKYDRINPERMLTYHGSFMPQRYRTTMDYTEFWRDTTAGGVNTYLYRGNSIFDPYAGASGNSTYGLDSMQNIYQWYKAHGSAITVRLVNNGTEPIMAYLYSAYSSAAPTVYTAEAAPRVKKALINVNAGKETILRSSAKITDFTASPQDISWGAATTGNPSVMWYWKILLKNVGTSSLAVSITVGVSYDTEFSLRTEEDDVDA